MIFARDKGRMCNNILQFGHVYAWAREHGRKAVSMRFAYKYQYFHVCHTTWHHFIVYVLAKYAGKVGLLPVASFHNEDGNAEAQHILETHKWVLVEGWHVRYYDLFLKYKQEILELFAFDSPILNRIVTMMDEECERSEKTIRLGLHVRRGDYKTWHDGKFYYTDGQYAGAVKRFQDLYSDKRVCVFVCGNDPNLASLVSLLKQQGMDACFPGGNPAEDLCMLSECDYIIGAPSTFSLVAAMYHDLPLHWMMSADAPFRFGRFDQMFRNIL